MKTRIILLSLVMCSRLSLDAGAPRILATPERINAIQSAIRQSNSHHALAAAEMIKRVDNPNLQEAYPSGLGKYEEGYRAREAAFISLISLREADQRKYADIAYEMALKAANNRKAPIDQMDRNSGSGLAAASNGMSVALAYNWMQDTWTDVQSETIRKQLLAGLAAWAGFKHVNVRQSHDASNWVAVTRGAEFIMMYATGEQNARSSRLDFVRKRLVNHTHNASGDLGVGQEGLGYIEYPGVFLLPAALIDKELGNGDLWNATQKRAWWKLAMYTHSFAERNHDQRDQKFLLWGVGARGQDQGWASLLLPTVPPAQLPYFLWWYDRHMGKEFKGPGMGFDRHRGGAVWAMLLYPTNVNASDPTGRMPAMVKDSHGYFFFRNRWQDAMDIQFMVAADAAKSHSNAWDQHDALTLSMLAQNSRFISGPGKNRDENGFSTLLVNGKYAKGSTTRNGAFEFSEASENGGHVKVSGGSVYSALDVKNASREVAVEFSRPGANIALISILDRVVSDRENTYTWQLNTGNPDVKSNISVQSGLDQGRKTFTLTGKDNGYLKGWVLYPDDAEILNRNDPFQLQVKAKDTEIWVVLMSGSGTPPPVRLVGQGMRSGLEIGSIRTYHDANTDKLVIKKISNEDPP
jgi:hypothetical protein